MENKVPKADYEDILDFGEVALALYKRLGVIILITVLCAGVGFFYSKFIVTQQYQASAAMIANSGHRSTDYVTGDQLAASASLVELYSIIIKSDMVMDAVYKNLQEKDTEEATVTDISVSSVNNTPVMVISVNATSPKYALAVCEEITNVAPGVIRKYMGAGSMDLLSAASAGSKTVLPHTVQNTGKAGLFGFLAVCGIIVLGTLLNNKVKKEEDLRQIGIPLLGVIPGFNWRDK